MVRPVFLVDISLAPAARVVVLVCLAGLGGGFWHDVLVSGGLERGFYMRGADVSGATALEVDRGLAPGEKVFVGDGRW